MMRPIAVVAALVVALGVTVSSARGEAKPSEQFVLSGVVVLEGGRGLAWLQEPVLTGNRIVTVRAGDAIGPYRVAKILEDHIELEGPTGKVLVPLTGPGGAAAVASVAPEPASPSGAAPFPPLSPEAVRRYEEKSPFGELIKKLRAAPPAPQAAVATGLASPALTDPRVQAVLESNPGNPNGWRALFGGR
jgi:hypothetical protein